MYLRRLIVIGRPLLWNFSFLYLIFSTRCLSNELPKHVAGNNKTDSTKFRYFECMTRRVTKVKGKGRSCRALRLCTGLQSIEGGEV
jgi:hypothetical protein